MMKRFSEVSRSQGGEYHEKQDHGYGSANNLQGWCGSLATPWQHLNGNGVACTTYNPNYSCKEKSDGHGGEGEGHIQDELFISIKPSLLNILPVEVGVPLQVVGLEEVVHWLSLSKEDQKLHYSLLLLRSCS